MLSALCSIFLVWYINLNHIKKNIASKFLSSYFCGFYRLQSVFWMCLALLSVLWTKLLTAWQ